MMLLTTTGPSAEWCGPVFGLYKVAGMYNGSKYYHQLDRGNNGHYIYQSSNDHWMVWHTLGETKGYLMYLKTLGDVSVNGWFYNKDDAGNWYQDEGVKFTPIENMASVHCGDITISMPGGETGVFKPTRQMSQGRQIFRNPRTGKYLSVGPRALCWAVRDNVDSSAASVHSGCAPDMCPASPRASYSDRAGWRHWQYSSVGWNESEEIIVKCSTHSNLRERGEQTQMIDYASS